MCKNWSENHRDFVRCADHNQTLLQVGKMSTLCTTCRLWLCCMFVHHIFQPQVRCGSSNSRDDIVKICVLRVGNSLIIWQQSDQYSRKGLPLGMCNSVLRETLPARIRRSQIARLSAQWYEKPTYCAAIVEYYYFYNWSNSISLQLIPVTSAITCGFDTITIHRT